MKFKFAELRVESREPSFPVDVLVTLFVTIFCVQAAETWVNLSLMHQSTLKFNSMKIHSICLRLCIQPVRSRCFTNLICFWSSLSRNSCFFSSLLVATAISHLNFNTLHHLGIIEFHRILQHIRLFLRIAVATWAIITTKLLINSVALTELIMMSSLMSTLKHDVDRGRWKEFENISPISWQQH